MRRRPSVKHRAPAAARVDFWHDRLQPIAGIDLRWREENRWHTDRSLRAGISFENVSILGRNLQILAESYKGRSLDGQFFIASARSGAVSGWPGAAER